MLSDSELQALLSQLDALKAQVGELKTSLSQLAKQKDTYFHQRHEVSIEIRRRIGQVREERTRRDSLTKVVKVSKVEREQASVKIKDLLAELKKLQDERQAALQKLGPEADPGEIKFEIRRIERMIETGGISFEKEKEMMKRSKKLKVQLDKFKGADLHGERIATIKHELDSLRKVSESAHNSVQKTAHESQVFHEAIVTESKQIDDLKAKEDGFTKLFEETKAKMQPLEHDLEKNLAEMDQIRTTLEQNNVHVQQEQHRSSHEILRKKEAAVEEKLKKKMTLTTEDLLVFQRQSAQGRK